MRRGMINLVLGLLAAAVLCLAGCGGSGGGGAVATVYGTASEGALITGQIVKLKDAEGRSALDATTDPVDGSYSIDVTGLTAPFLITVHGNNGYYLSLAPTAGKANINPITTSVIALASGAANLPTLFSSFTPEQLAAITSGYSAKCALLTASLRAVLPNGIGVDDYFTGTITPGSGMDGLFDSYRISVDPVSGILVKSNDAAAGTLLSIPVAAINANNNDPLPRITTRTVSISATGTNVWTVYGWGLDRIGGISLSIRYETALGNPVVTPGSVLSGALTSANTTIPGKIGFVAAKSTPFSSSSGDIVTITFGSGTGKVTGMTVTLATADDNPTVVPAIPNIIDPASPEVSTPVPSTEGYAAQAGI
ncbi:hypothetical protein KI809_06100 [Geobacter pelophilus]|uniref:Carboxypeptidase regulatory-like domain-containing protein n=1 Tax=Geoanaerobacter pelophilus TaxID=60036 RepID=A0AAW4L251_9BACT|nr:hypothetical protein [Geoanaerobacter pelophilus]MBT0663870.1 hypothetical protein [Geoanaerobacter pelophilus]